MWLIEPRFFRAEYSGLIAAPGTPNAQTTPFHTLSIYFGSGVIIRGGRGYLNEIEFVSHHAEWIAKYARYQTIRRIQKWKKSSVIERLRRTR